MNFKIALPALCLGTLFVLALALLTPGGLVEAQVTYEPSLTTATAGTATLTNYRGLDSTSYRVCHIAWTSDASGDVDGATLKNVSGKLVMVAFNPGATSPTANYDVTLTSANGAGIDVLDALGSNLSATANSVGAPMAASSQTGSASKPAVAQPFVVAGPLLLDVANAGDSKQGVIELYFER